jgi:hypothetical protein
MTFSWVAERVAAGRLELHGASFDIRNGKLLRLGADGRFTEATLLTTEAGTSSG